MFGVERLEETVAGLADQLSLEERCQRPQDGQRVHAPVGTAGRSDDVVLSPACELAASAVRAERNSRAGACIHHGSGPRLITPTPCTSFAELPEKSVALVMTSPPFALAAARRMATSMRPTTSNGSRPSRADPSCAASRGQSHPSISAARGSAGSGTAARSNQYEYDPQNCGRVFHLARILWYNPAKLPTPAEWVRSNERASRMRSTRSGGSRDEDAPGDNRRCGLSPSMHRFCASAATRRNGVRRSTHLAALPRDNGAPFRRTCSKCEHALEDEYIKPASWACRCIRRVSAGGAGLLHSLF